MALRTPALPALAAALAVCLIATPPANAAEPVAVLPATRSGLAVTIYQGGFALVRDTRRASLPTGASTLTFTDLIAGLDPATLDLAVGDAQVGDIAWQPATLSAEALIRRAVGGPVQVIDWSDDDAKRRPGTLVGITDSYLVRFADGSVEAVDFSQLVFPTLPADLTTETVALAGVTAPAAGTRDLTLSYLAQGLSWQASWSARLAADNASLDLALWATVRNDTGADLPAARLSLVAGDVQRIAPSEEKEDYAPQRARMAMATAPSDVAPAAAGEYQLFDTGRSVDLPAGAVRQVRLYAARSVPATVRFRTAGAALSWMTPVARTPQPVEVRLSFANAAAGPLGKPLPAGTLRVQGEAAGAPVFLGETHVPATPVGETVDATVGRAFDVTARRTVVEVRTEGQRGEIVETAQKIELLNARDSAATVEVVERIDGDWRMLSESAKHVRSDAAHAVWTVEVPANGTVTLDYRVRVTRR